MLLTSLYSTHLSAKCHPKDQTLLFCEIQQSGKILEVCDRGETLSYLFGKKGKPELALIIPRKNASTTQWEGLESPEIYSVTIPNGDAKYKVFWRIEKVVKGPTETFGVIAEVKGKEVVKLNCISKTVDQNLVDVNLKPEEKKKLEPVKGPIFSTKVILSQKAKVKMTELGEKITVSAMFSATREVPLTESINSDDPTIIYFNDAEIEVNPSEVAHFRSILFKKRTFDKAKKNDFGERDYELVLNAYSAGRVHKNNLLICSTFMTDTPRLLNHKHVRLWCSLNDEASRTPQKAEVVGKEKNKYDTALQNCFDQYKIMNNTVLASCKEEVSSEFKGTEREYLQAPKLEGLVYITGSYERQDDRWDFSLDEENEEFHLIHTIKDKRVEVLIADGLELIEGNRYSLNVENMYGDFDPKLALIFNSKTNHYDLEVKKYDKSSSSWKYLIFSGK